MPKPSWRRLAAVLMLALLAVSCVSTQLPPISASGGGFKPLQDERELWDQSREEEKQLLEKVRLYKDPLLEDYLQDVVSRLNPPGMAANPEIRYRVRVIEDPTLNAFAYPHGSLYVHTGLLARLDNEDQLATVFGHEMSHVENRHMLRYQRSARNKAIGLTVAAVAASVIAAAAESDALKEGNWVRAATIDAVSDLMISLGLQLAFLASINGYGRELEQEADYSGFTKMAAAGYHLGEAPKVYQALFDNRGEPRRVEAFFFGSHPRLSERIENTKHYVAAHSTEQGPVPEPAADSPFARRIRPVVRDDARLNLEMGRFHLAESEPSRRGSGCPTIQRPASSRAASASPRPPPRRTPRSRTTCEPAPRTPSAKPSGWTTPAPPRTGSWASCSTAPATAAEPAARCGATWSWPPTRTTRRASGTTSWSWSRTGAAAERRLAYSKDLRETRFAKDGRGPDRRQGED